jgi:hypothetical protein
MAPKNTENKIDLNAKPAEPGIFFLTHELLF